MQYEKFYQKNDRLIKIFNIFSTIIIIVNHTYLHFKHLILTLKKCLS